MNVREACSYYSSGAECFFLYIHEGMHTILYSIFAPYYLKVLVGQFSFAIRFI